MSSIINKIISYFKTKKNSEYINHLKYVLSRIEDKDHYDFYIKDLEYKQSIVSWLLSYYSDGKIPPRNITPEKHLENLLNKRTTEVSKKDYIYVSVLYTWIKQKQIEGF